MPKMIIHAPAGTFDPAACQRIAAALTDLGLACEQLPASPFVRSTVWTYFNHYSTDAVFMGGEPATCRIVTLQIYVIAGGLDMTAKSRFIQEATAILGKDTRTGNLAPVYIVINEVAESNWGIFGANADLVALRATPHDAPAI